MCELEPNFSEYWNSLVDYKRWSILYHNYYVYLEYIYIYVLGLAKRDLWGLGAESWFVVNSKPSFCQNDWFKISLLLSYFFQGPPDFIDIEKRVEAEKTKYN